MKRIAALLTTFTMVFGAMAQAPANDACSDAQLISPVATGGCASGSVQGSTELATATAPAPTCDGTGTIQDVWYSFNTAGFTGNFTMDITAGTAAHWGVQLYLGGCSGVLVGCYGSSPTSTVLPSLVADQNYTIRLFTNTDIGAAGSFTLCLSATAIASDCGTTVYDSGGPSGNYESGIFPYQEVYTYCPGSSVQAINMAFTQFRTRSEDIVRIYDGPDINSPLLGTMSGNLNASLPGPFQSTHPTGCITLRFNYNSFFSTQAGWAADLTCCAQPVLQVSPTSNSPICQGDTLRLDPGTTAGTSFVWSGPNGFTSTEQFPELPDFEIANVGSYSVVTSAGIPGCTSNNTATMVTMTTAPTSLSATASSNLLCGPGNVDLVAQAATLVQALQQGFETFPATGWATSGSGISAATNTDYFAEGTRSVRMSYTSDGEGSYGMTSDINLATTPNAVLSFKHICALEQGWDYGFVDYSVNGGSSWSTLPASTYQGTNNSNFTGGNVRFSRNSAGVWQSQFTSSSSNPGAGPATALWQQETFNLSQFSANTTFRLRFRITSDSSNDYYGWLIDDVQVSGASIPSYVWSSEPAGFSSTEQSPSDVPLSATTIFTVTASTAPGCELSETVTVELLGSVPSINGPAEITRCAGIPFDLTSSLSGGDAPFTYVWTSNGSVVGAGASLLGLILSNSSEVVLTVTDASGCQNTASVDVTVAAPPAVSLASFTSACVNWAPFALSGGLPAGGSYTVNGTPATDFDPSAGVGVYTVVYKYTDANGCSGTAQRTLLVDACTGLDEMQALGLSVYPNPASDVLYITANAGKYNIELLDAAGRLVLSSNLNVGSDRERMIPLDDCVNGIYIVAISSEDGQRYTKRLVIAR